MGYANPENNNAVVWVDPALATGTGSLLVESAWSGLHSVSAGRCIDRDGTETNANHIRSGRGTDCSTTANRDCSSTVQKSHASVSGRSLSRSLTVHNQGKP